MATSTAPAVPPSLLGLYTAVATTRKPTTSTSWVTTPRKSPPTGFRPGQSVGNQGRADRDAIWLTDRYLPGLTGVRRNQYVADRKAEILSAEFPAPWWKQLIIYNEYVTTDFPVCSLCVNCVALAYRDPLRRASRCKHSLTGITYTQPAPKSGLPQPSPGWYGEVAATQYKDKWWASLAKFIRAPVPELTNNGLPMWMLVESASELRASDRGNRLWGGVSITINPIRNLQTIQYPLSGANLTTRFILPPPAAPAAQPWASTVQQRALFSTRNWIGANNRPVRTAQNLVVLISAFPPSGRYFARNDWCGCWLTATLQGWIAATPP